MIGPDYNTPEPWYVRALAYLLIAVVGIGLAIGDAWLWFKWKVFRR